MISKKIPRTADRYIIYPGMPVFICYPYSIPKAIPKTIHHVEEGNYCIFNENRYLDNDHWEDGNTEHTSIIFFNKKKCIQFALNIINK